MRALPISALSLACAAWHAAQASELVVSGPIVTLGEHETFATWGQAINVWEHKGKDLLVLQVNNDKGNQAGEDDKEYVRGYDASVIDASSPSKYEVELTCGFSDTAIPRDGPYVYEAHWNLTLPGCGNAGGLTVHNLLTADKKQYSDLFAVAEWMEASESRPVLFICIKAEGKVVAYDVSAPMTQVKKLGEVQFDCAWGEHDNKLIDEKVGAEYRTTLIDPLNQGNRGYAFKTTDLGNWVPVGSHRYDWVDSDNGLGNVVAARLDSGEVYNLATWHCSTVNCDSSYGNVAHVIDRTQLAQFEKIATIEMSALTKGSIGRDAACLDGGICLVSLSWDGVQAVELGKYQGQFSPIASIRGQFASALSGVANDSHKRLLGAQRVLASRRASRRWFVEKFDVVDTGYARGREVHVVHLAGYERAALTGQAPAPEPYVEAKLSMRTEKSDEELRPIIISSMAAALELPDDRISIAKIVRMADRLRRLQQDKQRVVAWLQIRAGGGKSLTSIEKALEDQLDEADSAIYRSELGTMLDHPELDSHDVGIVSAGGAELAVFFALLALILVAAGGAIYFRRRKSRAAAAAARDAPAVEQPYVLGQPVGQMGMEPGAVAPGVPWDGTDLGDGKDADTGKGKTID